MEYDIPKSEARYTGRIGKSAKKPPSEERTTAPTTADEQVFLTKLQQAQTQQASAKYAVTVINHYKPSLMEEDGEIKIYLEPPAAANPKFASAVAYLLENQVDLGRKKEITLMHEGKPRKRVAREISIKAYDKLLQLAEKSAVDFPERHDIGEKAGIMRSTSVIDPDFIAASLKVLEEHNAKLNEYVACPFFDALPQEVRTVIADFRSKTMSRHTDGPARA
jgi:hypothetical protein